MMMIVLTFDQNNPPYSRQKFIELETQFDIARIDFCDIPDHVVVDYLPSSVKSIYIDSSPNITFAVSFPNVRTVDIRGEFIAFDDAMFRLGWCFLASDNPIQPGQIKLRHTDVLLIYRTVLHVDSLRNAHAQKIVLRFCRSISSSTIVVPVIANGVSVLTVHSDATTLPEIVHLASIPDSLTHIRVPENDLSMQALEMLHSHNQRLRYTFGPNAVQTHLIHYNRRRYDPDDVAPQNFTQENAKRDLYAHRIHLDLTRKFGDAAANQILQNVYGSYYKAAKFGTTLGKSQN